MSSTGDDNNNADDQSVVFCGDDLYLGEKGVEDSLRRSRTSGSPPGLRNTTPPPSPLPHLPHKTNNHSNGNKARRMSDTASVTSNASSITMHSSATSHSVAAAANFRNNTKLGRMLSAQGLEPKDLIVQQELRQQANAPVPQHIRMKNHNGNGNRRPSASSIQQNKQGRRRPNNDHKTLPQRPQPQQPSRRPSSSSSSWNKHTSEAPQRHHHDDEDATSVTSNSSRVSFKETKIGQLLSAGGFTIEKDFEVEQQQQQQQQQQPAASVKSTDRTRRTGSTARRVSAGSSSSSYHSRKQQQRQQDDAGSVTSASSLFSFKDTKLGQMLASGGFDIQQDFACNSNASSASLGGVTSTKSPRRKSNKRRTGLKSGVAWPEQRHAAAALAQQPNLMAHLAEVEQHELDQQDLTEHSRMMDYDEADYHDDLNHPMNSIAQEGSNHEQSNRHKAPPTQDDLMQFDETTSDRCDSADVLVEQQPQPQNNMETQRSNGSMNGSMPQPDAIDLHDGLYKERDYPSNNMAVAPMSGQPQPPPQPQRQEQAGQSPRLREFSDQHQGDMIHHHQQYQQQQHHEEQLEYQEEENENRNNHEAPDWSWTIPEGFYDEPPEDEGFVIEEEEHGTGERVGIMMTRRGRRSRLSGRRNTYKDLAVPTGEPQDVWDPLEQRRRLAAQNNHYRDNEQEDNDDHHDVVGVDKDGALHKIHCTLTRRMRMWAIGCCLLVSVLVVGLLVPIMMNHGGEPKTPASQQQSNSTQDGELATNPPPEVASATSPYSPVAPSSSSSTPATTKPHPVVTSEVEPLEATTWPWEQDWRDATAAFPMLDSHHVHLVRESNFLNMTIRLPKGATANDRMELYTSTQGVVPRGKLCSATPHARIQAIRTGTITADGIVTILISHHLDVAVITCVNDVPVASAVHLFAKYDADPAPTFKPYKLDVTSRDDVIQSVSMTDSPGSTVAVIIYTPTSVAQDTSESLWWILPGADYLYWSSVNRFNDICPKYTNHYDDRVHVAAVHRANPHSMMQGVTVWILDDSIVKQSEMTIGEHGPAFVTQVVRCGPMKVLGAGEVTLHAS